MAEIDKTTLPEISKITLPNGITYDIKDATARANIASAVATETSRAQEAEANRYTKNETYTKEEVNNLITTPDEEDLTSVNVGGTDVIRFKDKLNNPLIYSGLGRVYLRKNLVNGVNILTQDMFYKGEVGSRVPNTNTIFIIQYDYIMTQNITIPANCVLKFEGGSISGNYTLTGNNTCIDAGLVKILDTSITINGTWCISEAYLEWFGDDLQDYTSALSTLITIGTKIHLFSKDYYIHNITISNNCYIEGSEKTNLKPLDASGDFIYIRTPFIVIDNVYFDGVNQYSNSLNCLVFGTSITSGAVEHQMRRLRNIFIRNFGGTALSSYIESGDTKRAALIANDIKINDCGSGLIWGENDTCFTNIMIGTMQGSGVVVNASCTSFSRLYVYASGNVDDTKYGVSILGSMNSISELRIQETRGTALNIAGDSNIISGDIDNCYPISPKIDNTLIELSGSYNKLSIVSIRILFRNQDYNLFIHGTKDAHWNTINANIYNKKLSSYTTNYNGLSLINEIDTVSNAICINNEILSDYIELSNNWGSVVYSNSGITSSAFSNGKITIPATTTSPSGGTLFRLFLPKKSYTSKVREDFELTIALIINLNLNVPIKTTLRIVVNNTNIDSVFYLKSGRNYLCNSVLNSRIKELITSDSDNIDVHGLLFFTYHSAFNDDVIYTIESARISYGKTINTRYKNYLESRVRYNSSGFALPVASDTGFFKVNNQMFSTNTGLMYVTNDGVTKQLYSKNATAKSTGTSTQRPIGDLIYSGFVYFDTLLVKPIWWTGDKWVDATGTSITYAISYTLTNITASNKQTPDAGQSYSTTLLANSEYSLPSTITVKIGRSTLTATTDYTYDSTTGVVTVLGVGGTGGVTDTLTIIASGVANS